MTQQEEQILAEMEREFIGEPGRPKYIEPDAAKGRERMERFVPWYVRVLEDIAEQEKRELIRVPVVLHDSPTKLGRAIAGKIEKTRYGGTFAAAAKFVMEFETRIGKETAELKESLGLCTGCSDVDLIVVCEDSIHISQLPVRHWCEDREGKIVLSNKDGMALEYVDGTGEYLIDDMVCPEWFFTKPREEVTSKDILDLTDVDQRRLAIQRYGVALLDDVAEVIEDDGEYRLVDLAKAFGSENLPQAKYLRMVNPSTGEVCLSGIENQINTIQDSLSFRASKNPKKLIWNPITIDGAPRIGGDPSQRQQGDVLLLSVTKEEFEERVKTMKKIEGRNFVLSPENQRRHTVGPRVEIFGDDVIQLLRTNGDHVLSHPEHGPEYLDDYVEVWAVVERDHRLGITRTEID